mgnify:CR=1 FL=1
MPIGCRAFARPEPAWTIPITRFTGNRAERLLQRERHRVSIDGIYRREQPVRAGATAKRRIQKAAECVNDVLGRELPAVMEQHAVPEARDVCHRVRLLELRQIGDDPKLLVDPHERAVEKLVRLLRCLVRSDARVEVRGGVGHRHDDHVARRAMLGAAAAQRQHRGEEPGAATGGAHHSASRLSSARSASACRGVKLSTSTARSRARSASSPAAGVWNRPSCWRRSPLPLSDGRPPRDKLVALQPVEDLAGANDDGRREAGEPGDLDAVAAIGAARYDLPQEDDVVLPFADDDMEVGHRRERICEIGELVVMRGEDASWAGHDCRTPGARRPPRRDSGHRTSPCPGRSRRGSRDSATWRCGGCSPSPASPP